MIFFFLSGSRSWVSEREPARDYMCHKCEYNPYYWRESLWLKLKHLDSGWDRRSLVSHLFIIIKMNLISDFFFLSTMKGVNIIGYWMAFVLKSIKCYPPIVFSFKFSTVERNSTAHPNLMLWVVNCPIYHAGNNSKYCVLHLQPIHILWLFVIWFFS